MLQKKKKFNFKNGEFFTNCIAQKKFMYYIENFIIMNMPLLGIFLFKVRYIILKTLKKKRTKLMKLYENKKEF